MNKEIKEVIKKNLPQEMGEVLQERFSELEKKEQELIEARSAVDILTKEKEKLTNEVAALGAKLSSHEAIGKRRKEVEAKEKAYDIKVLKLQLELEKHRTAEAALRGDAIKDVVHAVFRNTTLRNSRMETAGTISNYNPNTGHHEDTPDGSMNVDETKTED